MRVLSFVFILYMLAFLNSCHRHAFVDSIADTIKNNKVSSKSNIPKSDTKISDSLENIKLKYGFKLKIGRREDFGNFKTYSYLEVWHNNLKLFTDTTKEYEFDEKLYPILNQLKTDVFELLIKFNDRPSKDKLTFLRIENDKIIKNVRLPIFDNKPEKINGILEYSGDCDDSEEWDENGKTYIVYNPTLYFKFTENGLKLDSTLTILRNKEQYGKFNGFQYNENIGYPIDKNNKIDTVEKHVLRKNNN